MRFCTMFVVILFSDGLIGGEPPEEPILKIETGMHTAIIRRIAVDNQESLLITGSDDKTIRIWSLNDGRLLKVLRPPIAWGNEGKIYAVAISPDGKEIAGGGWTGYWDSKTYLFYIFNIQTGNIVRLIRQLPNVVFHASYSKDGRYLVVGLGGSYGIKIYDVTMGYSLVFEDKDYGDAVYGFDFSGEGKLVVACYDGYIRLYNNGFRLIRKKKTQGGTKPYSVSFSEDSSKIAVGYADEPSIEILSGDDLRYLYSTDKHSFSNCCWYSVSFSSDKLYAGGTCSKYIEGRWRRVIHGWEKEGREIGFNSYVAEDTILQILPLKYGVVFGSADPGFGIIDKVGRLSLRKRGEIADFRDMDKMFRLSFDGSIVSFRYDVTQESITIFDLKNLMFSNESEIKDIELLSPIMESGHIKVTEWKNSQNPKLDFRFLSISDDERSRSLAISADEKRFLLGADWNLRLFDDKGKELWKVPVLGTTWAVNISGNGKVAVAGFGDGTIRWYRMDDGRELLSFFPHKDKKRWAIWTPKGYYVASTGGEDLIGWHVNNGAEKAADFYPASRFRDRFYRPDVIAKIFEVYDEEKAIAEANEATGRKRVETSIKEILPPVIRVLSPEDGAVIKDRDITVRYILKNPTGEPITNIRVMIDGRPVSQERGIKVVKRETEEQDVREVRVRIPEYDCEIGLIAENKYGASEPSRVMVIWGGQKEGLLIKPRLYILAIGISRYKDPILRLKYGRKDAEDFVNVMKMQRGMLYEEIKWKLLTDENATKEEILDGLEWLQKETTHKDVGMLFIAGHGINDNAGIYYFLPYNVELDRLKRTGVPFSDIKNTVSGMAGKVVMFVDTCHSGKIMGGRRGDNDITGVINELTSAENGVVVFASSTGRQFSLENREWGNGAFTKALVEGLKGKADLLGRGKITINMLDTYISERVKELTKGAQTPVTTKPNTVPDFPIAVK